MEIHNGVFDQNQVAATVVVIVDVAPSLEVRIWTERTLDVCALTSIMMAYIRSNTTTTNTRLSLTRMNSRITETTVVVSAPHTCKETGGDGQERIERKLHGIRQFCQNLCL